MFEGLGKISEFNNVGSEFNVLSSSSATSRFADFKVSSSAEEIELNGEESVQSSSSERVESQVDYSSASVSSASTPEVASVASAAASSVSASTVVAGAVIGASVVGVVTTAITALTVSFLVRLADPEPYIYADASSLSISYEVPVEYNSEGIIYIQLDGENGQIGLQEYHLLGEGQAEDWKDIEKSNDEYPFFEYVSGQFGAEDGFDLQYGGNYSLSAYYYSGNETISLFKKTDLLLLKDAYVGEFSWHSETDSMVFQYSYELFYRSPVRIGNYLLDNDGNLIDLGNVVNLELPVDSQPDSEGYYRESIYGSYSFEEAFSGFAFQTRNLMQGSVIFESQREISVEASPAAFIVEDFTWSSELDSMTIVYSYTVYYRETAEIRNCLVDSSGQSIEINVIALSAGEDQAPNEDGYYSATVGDSYYVGQDITGYSFQVVDAATGEYLYTSSPEIATNTSVALEYIEEPSFVKDETYRIVTASFALEYAYTVSAEESAFFTISITRISAASAEEENVDGDEIPLADDYSQPSSNKEGYRYLEFERTFFGFDAEIEYTYHLFLVKPGSSEEIIVASGTFLFQASEEVLPYVGVSDYYSMELTGTAAGSVEGQQVTYVYFDFALNGYASNSFLVRASTPEGDLIRDEYPTLSAEDYSFSQDYYVFGADSTEDDYFIVQVSVYGKNDDWIALCEHTIYFK